jgi:hypothetical protein
MDTFLVIIRNGLWEGGYEPHDMPYAFVSTRYTLEPAGGDPVPSDGHYRGVILPDGTLRLISGGEHAYGITMNQYLRDYKATFDEAFHSEFLAGVTRAVRGKRKLSWRQAEGKSQVFMDGYRSGLSVREASRAKVA